MLTQMSNLFTSISLQVLRNVTLYIHVTMRRNKFLFYNQPNALIIQIYSVIKLYFSAHHQEFSTVHSAFVSFMQVSDDRFQAESGCSILTLLGSVNQNLRETYQC